MIERQDVESICPHCHGERTLGDCQVTRRIEMDVESTLKEIKERREKVLVNLKTDPHMPALVRMDGKCGEVLHDGCAVLEVLEDRSRSLSDYVEFFSHAPTDIDFLLSLLSQKDVEIGKFSTLADERHDLLSDAKRARDDARELYSKALTKLASQESRITTLRAECDQLRSENNKWQRAAGYWKAQHEALETHLSRLQKQVEEMKGAL
jgi:hypothetical protein